MTESVQSKVAFDQLLLELKIFIIKSSFNTVGVSINKANDIVNALKKNSHVKQSGNEESVEESDIVDSLKTVIMIQQHHLKRVELNLDFPEEAVFVKFNYSELTQIWSNILSNAYQALDKKDANEIKIKVEEDTSHVRVLISDNGMGISKENQEKVFDLYYSSKAVGKGVGIGLNIVRKSLIENNGAISLESTPRHGTTFTVTLKK